MRAENLDFSRLRYFDRNEFPGDVLDHMEALIILLLNKLRNGLPAGYSIYPSPVERAHVRQEESSSRHSTMCGKRLSDATDFFMCWEHIFLAWQEAQRIVEIGGIGLYLDTRYQSKTMPMMHIDARDERLLWVSIQKEKERIYVYHHIDPIKFHAVIGSVHARIIGG